MLERNLNVYMIMIAAADAEPPIESDPYIKYCLHH